MKRLNWNIISSNIQEAIEELQELEKKIASAKRPSEAELELSLRHAYHHLNSAWNIRHTETSKYRRLSEKDFKNWGKFPKGFDDLETYNEDL